MPLLSELSRIGLPVTGQWMWGSEPSCSVNFFRKSYQNSGGESMPELKLEVSGLMRTVGAVRSPVGVELEPASMHEGSATFPTLSAHGRRWTPPVKHVKAETYIPPSLPPSCGGLDQQT